MNETNDLYTEKVLNLRHGKGSIRKKKFTKRVVDKNKKKHSLENIKNICIKQEIMERCLEKSDTELINALVKKKMELLKINGAKENNLVNEEDKVSSEDEAAYKRWSERNPLHFPTVSTLRMCKFLKKIKTVHKPNQYERELELCSTRMNSQVTTHWQSPLTILSAINDCLLSRKWNNLTHFLIILLNNHSTKIYMPLIRHVCRIMDKMHPVIQEHGLKRQFTLIKKAAS